MRPDRRKFSLAVSLGPPDSRPGWSSPGATLRQLLRTARTRLTLLGRARVGRGVRVDGRVWIHGGGDLSIGAGAHIDAAVAPVELHVERGAVLEIGPGASIGGGTSIEATARVSIGQGARLGRYNKVLDNSFHVAHDRARRPPSVPVRIGANAVLGDRVILLPGANVGPGEHVPAGAVVRGPPRATESSLAVPANPDRASPARALGQSRARYHLQLLMSHPLLAVRIAIGLARGALLLRRHERGARVRIMGPMRIVREGRLHVGTRCNFLPGVLPTVLAAHPGGTLVVGEGAAVNYGATLEASSSVTLGAHCMVASMVRLVDTRDGRTAPIVIGDRVWLAHGAVVAPGVTVGAGSVVAAGCQVEHDVPPGCLVAGNPARWRPLLAAEGPAQALISRSA